LADMACVSPLMGDRRFPAEPSEPFPENVAHAAAAADADALTEALAELAGREPARTGKVMVDLYRRAQENPALHAALCVTVIRAPARPPYLPGLRKLFKYAEMLDDTAMFGATAHRFETARPMYKGRPGRQNTVYVHELGGWVKPDHLQPARGRKATNIRTGLGEATHQYMKRRIWRALRKRAELGQESFLEMAVAYLLSFVDTDIVEESRRYVWKRDGAGGRFSRHTHVYGPFAYAWTMGQLLYRHSPAVRLQESALAMVEVGDIDSTRRTEAFPELWDQRPEFALRLAAESCCQNVAGFGVRVLRSNPQFLAAITVATLETLLASPHVSAARLAFDEARNRLARGGGADPELLAALLKSELADARGLAVERISGEPSLPWTSARLGLAVLTSDHDDVVTAAAGWPPRQPLDGAEATELARLAGQWLLALPPVLPDERTVLRVQRLRRWLAVLWPAPSLPLASETMELLLNHGSPQVAAAGVDALALSAADPRALPDALWQRLLASPAPEVQAAALGLLDRLGDEQLAERAFVVMTLAAAPASEVRCAARPLAARLARRFERFAEDLFRRLLDSLFLAEPSEGYAQDAVALMSDALARQVEAMDAGLLWRLLQAKAKGARLLGAAAVTKRDPAIFSVRQLARLGNHSQLSVRQWAMSAYSASPERFMAEAADAVLLLESDWAETHDFAVAYFSGLPDEVWTPDVLSVITDSVKPPVLALARDVLRRSLRPADAPAQLARLLEHPAPSMHLLITELLTADGVGDADAFARLVSFARIVMLQIHKGRAAKDRMAAFLHAEALASRERAQLIAPLFADLSLSPVERDRAPAILALRDIARAHSDLTYPGASPLVCRPLRIA
jgi:cellulose synthase operon protein C